MIQYDLPDIGIFYNRGGIHTPVKTLEVDGWKIVNIPIYEKDEDVADRMQKFLDSIVAIELPTSFMCNLRCKYCYIQDLHQKNRVTQKQEVEKILEYVVKNFKHFDPNSKREKYITPWGAEPLMNIGTLEVIDDFIRETYDYKNVKINTSTNGTIWNHRIEQLLYKWFQSGVTSDIQISLDGPPEVQDKLRPWLNGKDSFKDVEKFVIYLIELSKELKIQRKVFHFSSTIYMKDEDFENDWLLAADFFSTPEQWWTSLPVLPMRVNWEDLGNIENVKRFVNAIEKSTKLLVYKYEKYGIRAVDFFAAKLFMSHTLHTLNAFPFCSALNTQIGIDLDGSLYPCHGAITSPLLKPFLWFGNLFEKTISYKHFMRNLGYQYGTTVFSGRCKSCPIRNYAPGTLAWTCAPHAWETTKEPGTDAIVKCIAYINSFKYWIKQAEVMMEEDVSYIPDDFKLKDFDYKEAEQYHKYKLDKKFNVKPLKRYEKVNIPHKKFDNILYKAWEKLVPKSDRMFYDINKFIDPLIDTWWKFDNFIEVVNKERRK